jgi:antimicrobial peptide system SdpB family protein
MLNVIQNRFQVFRTQLDEISNKSYFTNVYGFGRSLIALCTLITLSFNSKYSLFYKPLFEKNKSSTLGDINLFLLFDYEHLYVPQLISIFILLLVISGFYPRITGILHWWVSFSLLNSATLIEGGDQIAANTTLFLIPVTIFDKRKNHWNHLYIEKNSYINFTTYLIFVLISIQISALYLQAGMEKPYKVEEWMDGTVLYYWFNNNIFGLNSFMKTILNPILENKLLLFITNWSVIIFEIILFAALFMEKKNRKLLLPFGVLFHLMIIFTFGLVSFFFSMFGCLILYLYPKNEEIQFKKLWKLF